MLSAPFLSPACAAAPVACLSPAHCDAKDECLAHRCVPLGAEPVPPGAERRVVDATAVAVLGGGSGLPSVVSLGGPDRGETLVVRFPGAWRDLQVEAAFLLLSPAPGAEPSAEDVPIEVSLASVQWEALAGDRAARSHSPSHHALARTGSGGLLRIDVTPQVRALGREPQGSLLVRATSSTDRSAVYLTGANGGRPRLDMYGR